MDFPSDDLLNDGDIVLPNFFKAFTQFPYQPDKKLLVKKNKMRAAFLLVAMAWAPLNDVPAVAASVRPAFNYSWDTLSTYAFPGDIVGGNLTADQVEYFSKFSLLLYWGIDVRPDPSKGPGWYVPDQEGKAIAQAAVLKAANKDIKLFPYITGFMAQTWFAAQAEFNKPENEGWWLKDPATGVALDCNSSSSNA